MATTAPCILRHELGMDFVDPELTCDGLSGGEVVAGAHDDFQAHVVQGADRFRAGRLDRIGDGENAREFGIGSDPYHRLGVFLQLLRALLPIVRNVNALFGEER